MFVNVDVLYKLVNSYEIGGGFNIDFGLKVCFKWIKFWIIEDGYYLESNLNVFEK